jgi:hypothetical protein
MDAKARTRSPSGRGLGGESRGLHVALKRGGGVARVGAGETVGPHGAAVGVAEGDEDLLQERERGAGQAREGGPVGRESRGCRRRPRGGCPRRVGVCARAGSRERPVLVGEEHDALGGAEHVRVEEHVLVHAAGDGARGAPGP